MNWKSTRGQQLKKVWNLHLNLLHYAILAVLENKIHTTSHPNIGSLKTAIEEE